MIEMVLCTDMVKHTKFMTDFQRMTETVWKEVRAGAEFKDVLTKNHEARSLVLSNIVHSADLGGTTKTWVMPPTQPARVCSLFRPEHL